MPRTTISSIESEYRRYKALAESAMRQLTDAEFFYASREADNSVAVICRHIAGNLRSRFTDFQTSDGEKTWRDRESEFTAGQPSRREVLELSCSWQSSFAGRGGSTCPFLRERQWSTMPTRSSSAARGRRREGRAWTFPVR